MDYDEMWKQLKKQDEDRRVIDNEMYEKRKFQQEIQAAIVLFCTMLLILCATIPMSCIIVLICNGN